MLLVALALSVLLQGDTPPPTQALPWSPVPSPHWTPSSARHLLDRAGFGGPPAEVYRLFALGPEGAVDALLGEAIPPQVDDAFIPRPIQRDYRAARREVDEAADEMDMKAMRKEARKGDNQQTDEYRQFWLQQMVAGDTPAREKLALFWHGHFTSSIREVRDSYAMIRQIELFREQGLSSFADLLHQVSLDPAMLAYLDNDKNKKGAPNENFAREVMELFTMGPGHYTEQDIHEAARAFTGWKPDKTTGDARFFKNRHDKGPKTFLGRTGKLDAGDVLDILLEQPATAEHLVTKLWEFYAYPDPEPELVAALAAGFREDGYQLRPLLRRVLLSQAFHARQARAALFKSPVEFVVSTVRRLELEPPPGRFMASACEQLGQELLGPPNVKGWEGGETWISASTLFQRSNIAGLMLDGVDRRWYRSDEGKAMRKTLPTDIKLLRGWSSGLEPAALLARDATPAMAVGTLCDRLLPVAPSAATFEQLVTHVAPFGPDAFYPGQEETDALLAECVHLILSLPEYQLN